MLEYDNSGLPNPNESQVRLYPDEYVTNTTINRGILRLLQNDLWLENNIHTGSLTGAVLSVDGQDGHVKIRGVPGNKTTVTLEGESPKADIIIQTDTSDFMTKTDAREIISAMIQEMIPSIVAECIASSATLPMWNARWIDNVYVNFPSGNVSKYSGRNLYIDNETNNIIPEEELIFKK